MKNAAFAGLIAGIVWGITDSFISIGLLSVGLPAYSSTQSPATPFMEIFLPRIIFSSIYGIILGIIFSKIYNLIPGKTHALKGLVFGLGIYFIIYIRQAIFCFAYGYPLIGISLLLTVAPIIYGLILGILYKTSIQALETKHNMKDGVIPGAITGLIFAIVVVISFVTAAYFGFVFWFEEANPAYLTDIEFIINQYGAHTVINMFMMACYGAIYVRFYDAIPGKVFIKGAIFGFTIYVITNLFHSVYNLAYGLLSSALAVGLTFPDVYLGVGILLEGFYNKRWQAFPIAIVIFILSILKYYVLAMWLYPH